MSRLAVYRAGFVIIILGLGLAAYLVNIPGWIVVPIVTLVLWVLITKVTRARRVVDQSNAPKPLPNKEMGA